MVSSDDLLCSVCLFVCLLEFGFVKASFYWMIIPVCDLVGNRVRVLNTRNSEYLFGSVGRITLFKRAFLFGYSDLVV